MAWEFEHDLIVINNLDHSLLLDLLIKRGQKRIFLIGGNLDVANLKVEQPDVLVYRVEDHTHLDELVVAFKDLPEELPHLIVAANQRPWK